MNQMKQIKQSRRTLLLAPAALVAAPQPTVAQPPSATPTDATTQARAVLQANHTAIAKVKLPQSLEPAFSFKP